MTENTETQRRFHDALMLNETILASVSEGILGIGPDGRIILDNPAARSMLGYAEGELDGRDAHTTFHHHRVDGNPYPPADCPIIATLRDGQRRHVSGEVFFRKDGTPFCVNYSIAPVENGLAESELCHILAFRDVTEERAETGLRQMEADALTWIGEEIALDTILSRMAERISALVHRTSTVISIVEDGWLLCAAAHGVSPKYIAAINRTPLTVDVRSCGAAVLRKAQVISAEIASDPLWAEHGNLALENGLSACWSTPVINPHGDVVACLGLYAAISRRPSSLEKDLIGRIAQAIGMVIDRWRQAESLRRSEAHYRAIFDMLPVGVWEEDWVDVLPMLRDLRDRRIQDVDAFFLANPDFVDRAIRSVRPLQANAASAQMFSAASGEDLIAKKDRIISKPNARATFCRAMAACLRGERQLAYEVSTDDLSGKRLDFLLRMAIPELEGGETRAVLSEMDVTALNRANERFRTVAQAARDVIWDTDLLTQEVWASDGLYRLFGIDPNSPELSRETWSSRLHPEDRERMLEIQHVAIESGAPHWSGEYRFRRASEDYAIVRDQATILRDPNGQAVRMIGSIVDITLEREMQEQLRQAQRLDAIGQLTGGVAHDFNNLLTVTMGNAELLAESLGDRPDALGQARICLKAAERGAELTSRLLGFSRKQPLDPADTDLNRIVIGMKQLLGRTLTETLELSIDLSEDLWPVYLDPGQLEVALINLAVNARDAMPNGGRLTFSTMNRHLTEAAAHRNEVSSGDYSCVAVADSGTGMEPEVARRAFEPFYTTKEVGKGSGLGLSLVYGFARQSGGFAEIDSVPGTGTTITLYFPRANDGNRAA